MPHDNGPHDNGPHDVIMPALGMAQETGKIVAWQKSEGDSVKTGDVLFEVETDKATMEVEAQASGFLNGVRAAAGEDVPVGNVIAQIGSEAQASAPVAPAAPETGSAEALPEGAEVIMPALGMAQDTGLIVAWHKALGDEVAAGDILFEVETDKATMDVEAGENGFVAALLAEAGEAAPVGAPIAVISAEKPSNPVQRSQADAAAPVTSQTKADSAPDSKPEPEPAKVPQAPAPKRTDGRILASPKARRLALEQGLDLNRLVEAGHPQPYHVTDLEVLKALPEKTSSSAATASRHLTAELSKDGFAEFAAWASESEGLNDTNTLLAGLAAASLGQGEATITVESFDQARAYAVPAGAFSAITLAEEGATPELILRDLRMSRVSTVALGAEEAPVLTLSYAGSRLVITLECAGHHLTAAQAVSLLSEFAGRVEQPLRHLL